MADPEPQPMKSRQWSASTFLDGTMAVKMDIKEEMDDECLIKKLEELLFNFVSYAIGCVQCVFLCFSKFSRSWSWRNLQRLWSLRLRTVDLFEVGFESYNIIQVNPIEVKMHAQFFFEHLLHQL